MNPILFALPFIEETAVRVSAFSDALKLTNSKGIINIGCSGNKLNPIYPFCLVVSHNEKVVVNADFRPAGMPNFVQANLEETLPFGAKEFDVAFCSHTLEHIENWQGLLNEMDRIADHIVVVIPHFLMLISYFHPDHKNHFSPQDVVRMEKQYGNLKVYW